MVIGYWLLVIGYWEESDFGRVSHIFRSDRQFGVSDSSIRLSIICLTLHAGPHSFAVDRRRVPKSDRSRYHSGTAEIRCVIEMRSVRLQAETLSNALSSSDNVRSADACRSCALHPTERAIVFSCDPCSDSWALVPLHSLLAGSYLGTCSLLAFFRKCCRCFWQRK